MNKLVLCLLATLALPAALSAQQLDAALYGPAGLPNAPLPQSSSSAQQTNPDAASSQEPKQGAQVDTSLSAEERKKKADEQIKQEEQQRILGVMPDFNAVIAGKGIPLTPGQKFKLFFRGAFDPYQFALAGISSGIEQAENSYPEYHQGVAGYARRYGAAFADSFDGNLWGNAILPSLLHQDPRYYRLGHGKIMHRLLYAAATTVICKGDNGHWEPNYSNVLGNFIGGGFSNLYYPDSDRGVALTLERGATTSGEGAFGAELIEFYPDISHYYHRKHQEKLARQAAAEGARQAQDVAPPPTVPAKPVN